MLDLLPPQYCTCIIESFRRYFWFALSLSKNKALLIGTASEIIVLIHCYSFEINLRMHMREIKGEVDMHRGMLHLLAHLWKQSRRFWPLFSRAVYASGHFNTELLSVHAA